MTDKEKAATFIGWKPDLKCKGGKKGVRCIHGEYLQHVVATPDMSDPRNYMKALYSPSIAGFLFVHDDGGDHFIVTATDGRLFEGYTATQALAALYDAEQKP